MKIAMLGGSFNPIHIGHLILADSVCTNLGYDKILFVPTFCPPHKEMSCPVDSDERFEMVRLSVEDDERFEAEDCELRRGGVSYTWDTICYLEKKYESVLTGKLGFIMGEDLLPDYDRWFHAKELSEKADLILAVRPEDTGLKTEFQNAPTENYGKSSKKWINRNNFPYPHIIVENPKIEISSSEIRQKVAENGAWRYLVSKKVFDYIKDRNLYAK